MTSQRWDLDSLFSGGSRSPALESLMEQTKHRLNHLKKAFHSLSDLNKGILEFQELDGRCFEIQSFIHCLLNQDTEDHYALILQSQATQLQADCESVGAELDAALALIDDAAFQRLLEDPEIHPIAFNIQERRNNIKDKLSTEQESLINQLSIDGFHGWNELYGSWMGNLRIESPLKPGTFLSIAQAENRLVDPDRTVRQAWFHRLDETWKSHENLAAQMLNHLSGYRLNLYAARNWSSVLKEPLCMNRMSEETLHTMWRVVEENKSCLHDYLKCKAKLLGLEQLAWYDVDAPLPFGYASTISYDQAAQFIVKHFTAFSPAMGTFAQEAFERRWIEAEDRAGKRPGGFCVQFPLAKQGRIFMTYSETMLNVFTLAHELGHAYHNHEVRMLPPLAQKHAMNVAETASTLAEVVMIDAMMKESEDPKIQLTLLDNKLQRSMIFLMNLHARYLFELDFYQERRKGYVLAEDLNLRMEEAQKKAFENGLSEWNPRFWISKQHFYFTEFPFYNFPYTFGYLFSQGIYARLRKQPQTAAEAYSALLRDTGRLSVEELAQRHLEEDLTKPTFWEGALRLIKQDVADYVELASKDVNKSVSHVIS